MLNYMRTALAACKRVALTVLSITDLTEAFLGVNLCLQDNTKQCWRRVAYVLTLWQEPW